MALRMRWPQRVRAQLAGAKPAISIRAPMARLSAPQVASQPLRTDLSVTSILAQTGQTSAPMAAFLTCYRMVCPQNRGGAFLSVIACLLPATRDAYWHGCCSTCVLQGHGACIRYTWHNLPRSNCIHASFHAANNCWEPDGPACSVRTSFCKSMFQHTGAIK